MVTKAAVAENGNVKKDSSTHPEAEIYSEENKNKPDVNTVLKSDSPFVESSCSTSAMNDCVQNEEEKITKEIVSISPSTANITPSTGSVPSTESVPSTANISPSTTSVPSTESV